MAQRRKHTLDSFMERVKKTDGCWLWTGARGHYGHGTLRHHGRMERAHRVIYRYTYGSIPDGAFICHHCDNPPCVNPDHLYLGNAKTNNRDTVVRGRYRNQHMKKTACPSGHQYTKSKNGKRHCRICKASYLKSWWEKRRQGIPLRESSRRHDYQKIYDLKDKTKFSVAKIAKILGYTEGVVAYALIRSRG